MYYIYDKTSVQSILENLYANKYIKQSGKLYEFYINNNTLMLNAYNDDSTPLLMKTFTLEKNVKGEFGICEDEENVIHIIVANKKYDLIYIRFDGEKTQKEIVYSFNNNFVIPTTPTIQVKNNLIVVGLEFINVGEPKEWSLRVYTKRNGLWEYKIMDTGTGLCYIQPDFKLDDQMNLHLIYREFKEKSYLRYLCLDLQRPRQEKAKIILESESNKYVPSLFIKGINEIFICWVEINDSEATLCCTNISVELNREIFRVDISQNISDVRIYFFGRHIYCVFQNEAGYYYDMCCREKVLKQWNPKIIPKKGGVAMSSDFRLFLDIKRELEYRITELKNADTFQNEKIINDLKLQNINLIEQINEKQKDIEIALKENILLRYENEKYKNNEEQLRLQLESKQDNNQKTSIWSSVVRFFNG